MLEAGIIAIPPMSFLMLDGAGDPSTSREFQTAVEALNGVAQALRATLRKTPDGPNYAVMPLEALWWTGGTHFDLARRDLWKWTLMIMQPDAVQADLFLRTKVELEQKKRLPSLRAMRLERFSEGRAAQLMHVGAFAEVPRTIERLHEFVRRRGLRPQGKHHEIYLSDPRRTPAEKLRTLIRQPVE